MNLHTNLAVIISDLLYHNYIKNIDRYPLNKPINANKKVLSLNKMNRGNDWLLHFQPFEVQKLHVISVRVIDIETMFQNRRLIVSVSTITTKRSFLLKR